MAKFILSLILGCIVWTSSATARDGTIVDAMMATYKITNQNSTATCFVISRKGKSEPDRDELILITAAHVLERMAGNECMIVARQKQDDGTFKRVEIPLKIRSGNQKLWVRHPRVDVAALILDPSVAESVVGLGFHQLAQESDLKRLEFCAATEVWIPGFPAQLESSPVGFPVLRSGSVASFPLLPVTVNKTFMVNAETVGGDSGGPVLFRSPKTGNKHEQLTVVGIVIGQHRETTKTVSTIEERTFHRPLGLAIAIHAEFIRQTVDLIKPPRE